MFKSWIKSAVKSAIDSKLAPEKLVPKITMYRGKLEAALTGNPIAWAAWEGMTKDVTDAKLAQVIRRTVDAVIDNIEV